MKRFYLAAVYSVYVSTLSFMNDLDRFCSATFKPSEQDILAARIMTTTITETRVQVQQAIIRIFDVGGQRSERKKWAPYFDDVSAIIYVADLASFNKKCAEDDTTNRSKFLILLLSFFECSEKKNTIQKINVHSD